MTDDRRDTDRWFAQMETRLLDTICGMFDTHIEEQHVGLSKAEIAEKIVEHDANETKVGRIVELLEGTPIESPVTGDVIGYDGGIVQQMTFNSEILSKLEHRTNGGELVLSYKVKRLWTRTEKIAAWSVGSFIFVGMLPTVINVIRYVAELVG